MNKPGTLLGEDAVFLLHHLEDAALLTGLGIQIDQVAVAALESGGHLPALGFPHIQGNDAAADALHRQGAV